MSIGLNIKKFRKIRGYTQEELGVKLGFTNQTVSKWESESSMPDVMLLPHIAKALGVTLNELYGIEEEKPDMVTADAFPREAYLNLLKYFYQQSGARFSYIDHSDESQLLEWIRKIDNGNMLGCISDIAGSVVVDRNIAFVNTNYKKHGSENIFESNMVARALRDLSDENCRKILLNLYKTSFFQGKVKNVILTLKEICNACGLSEGVAIDTLEKMTLLELIEKTMNDAHQVEYCFNGSNAIYALAIFNIVEIMISDKAWYVIRDSSIISDYAFEKLWK